MSIEIVITAALGLVASVAAAYATHRLTVRRERRRHEQDVAFKLAAIPSVRDDATRIMAVQFAEAVLVIERDSEPDQHRVFLPSGSRITLGRAPSNHIVVDHPNVSRTHAAFRSSQARTMIEPLGPRNPVLLNGRTTSQPARLSDGDVIEISGVADVRLHYREMDRS